MNKVISMMFRAAGACAITAQSLVLLLIWKAMEMPPNIDEAIQTATRAARAAKAALWASGLSITIGMIAVTAAWIYKPRRRS